MNGFLVLVRCGMDDLPVRLCSTRWEANEEAKRLRLADMEPVCNAFGMDVSAYHYISVVEFSDGEVVDVETIRDFDDEPDCEFPDGSQHDTESEVPDMK